MQKINVQLPEKLGNIFEGRADYRGAYGGRGGAKTIGFARMAIIDALRLSDTPWKFLCGRELQKSLKDSVFSVIAGQIKEMGLESQFDIGREFIRCKNGNEFLFYGLRSNIAEVKGLHGVRRTWLEEAQKVSQSSLTYLIPTVMRDFPDCELWASWNPDEDDDPIHKMFTENADDSFKVTKINWYDNPWFPDALNKVRLRDKAHNEARYEWIWEGSFNRNPEGAVYGKWITDMENQGRIRDCLYDPSLPVMTAWDLGYSDDTAIVFWQQVGNEIRVIDFYENNRSGIKSYAEALLGHEIIVQTYGDNGKVVKWVKGKELPEHKHRANYKYAGHFAPHDAANKLLQAGGRSAVDQMYEFGIRMRVVAATTQQNQIDGMRLTLEKMWIDETRCKDLIRALKKYKFSFNDEKGKYSDKPEHDCFSHACDAAEIIAQVWKSSIMQDEQAAPRYLNDMTANELFWPKNKAVNLTERI